MQIIPRQRTVLLARDDLLLLTIVISAGLNLPLQRSDPVVLRMMRFDGTTGIFYMLRFNQKAHSAGQIPLDRPRRRGDPVRYAIRKQEIPQRQPLFIICKEYVIS